MLTNDCLLQSVEFIALPHIWRFPERMVQRMIPCGEMLRVNFNTLLVDQMKAGLTFMPRSRFQGHNSCPGTVLLRLLQ